MGDWERIVKQSVILGRISGGNGDDAAGESERVCETV